MRYYIVPLVGYALAVAATVVGVISDTLLIVIVCAWCGGWFARRLVDIFEHRLAIRRAQRVIARQLRTERNTI